MRWRPRRPSTASPWTSTTRWARRASSPGRPGGAHRRADRRDEPRRRPPRRGRHPLRAGLRPGVGRRPADPPHAAPRSARPPQEPQPDLALARPGVEAAPRPGERLLATEVADTSLEYDRAPRCPSTPGRKSRRRGCSTCGTGRWRSPGNPVRPATRGRPPTSPTSGSRRRPSRIWCCGSPTCCRRRPRRGARSVERPAPAGRSPAAGRPGRPRRAGPRTGDATASPAGAYPDPVPVGVRAAGEVGDVEHDGQGQPEPVEALDALCRRPHEDVEQRGQGQEDDPEQRPQPGPPNGAMNMAGRANHRMMSAMRGNAPAKTAKRQPMRVFLSPLSRRCRGWPARGMAVGQSTAWGLTPSQRPLGGANAPSTGHLGGQRWGARTSSVDREAPSATSTACGLVDAPRRHRPEARLMQRRPPASRHTGSRSAASARARPLGTGRLRVRHRAPPAAGAVSRVVPSADAAGTGSTRPGAAPLRPPGRPASEAAEVPPRQRRRSPPRRRATT